MYKKKRLYTIKFYALLLLSFCFVNIAPAKAQTAFTRHLSEVEIRIDTNIYSYNSDKIFIENEWKIPFSFQKVNPTAELRIYPRIEGNEIPNYSIKKSSDYHIIDSLSLNVNGYFSCRIQFKDLSQVNFSKISLLKDGMDLDIHIFPYTTTEIAFYPEDNELYIGDKKNFEIITNQPDNIVINPLWIEKDGYEYRIHRSRDKIWLTLLPKKTGTINVDLTLDLYRPNFKAKKADYKVPLDKVTFNVKSQRLKFLTFDKRLVIWETQKTEGVELQIDNHSALQMKKTYRLEATDEPGGHLVAELYTVRRLDNDKVVCMFRPYNYHRTSSGYLYIKDGDNPRFITNIDILPESKIHQVSILRQGGNWINSKQLYPGETVEIRLEGEGLDRTDFRFEDLIDISTDSLIKSETSAHFLIKVPIDVRKKSVNIYSGRTRTGVMLDINEYQRPRDFDFVSIDYGEEPVIVKDIKEPLLFNGVVKDINIQFDIKKIDDDFELFGKQHIEIEVSVVDYDNKLLEKEVIDNIIICPGSSSPRFFSYGENGCKLEPISINDYISNKTHKLEHWSKIVLVIRHSKERYDGLGYSKKIEIIKAKYTTFDIDLSIPAGLMIKKVGEPGFPGLSGISLSLLAQFSFYQKGAIQKLRPFKVGGGFLAKNAFNFNPEAERDLGIVILGSVYPTKQNKRFSFPIYAGMGYFLYEGKFFFLIGPGISVNF